jgi:DNA-binding PadR family transcriptional regulator
VSLLERYRLMRRRHKVNASSRILAALADGEWHYGLDMMRATRMRSGRFYPALERLEDGGVVEARWDDSEDPPPKYRRRLYRLAPPF